MAFKLIALLLTAPLLPQIAEAQSDKPPVEKSLKADKPEKKELQTPRDFARQLLDSAHDAVGRAQPGAQAALLTQIGDCYTLFDKKNALGILEQAFSLAGSVSGGAPFAASHSADLQSSIVRSVTDLDLPKAAGMARAMPPEFRSRAIEVVVTKLLAKSDIDGAIELVNLGAGTRYPFAAVAAILKSLGDDDPRAAIVFGAALSGYQTSSDREFGFLLAGHWKRLPPATVRQALDAIITKVATYKDEASVFRISLSGANGTADLNTEREIELFDVSAPLEALEPDKFEQLEQDYPSLKKARALFPDGEHSPGASAGYFANSGRKANQPSEAGQQVALFNQSMKLKGQAEALAPANLPGALDLVKTIPTPVYQAATLIAIAEQRIESDSTAARDLLNKSLAILAKCDVDPYGDGVAQNEVTAAYDAHKLNDDELTRHALNLAFDTGAKFAALDFSADDPNELPEDMWPSTFSYQNAMRAAARIYKLAAVTYLDRIQNPDMFLFSQVALAASLLDRQQFASHGGHISKKKN